MHISNPYFPLIQHTTYLFPIQIAKFLSSLPTSIKIVSHTYNIKKSFMVLYVTVADNDYTLTQISCCWAPQELQQ